MRDYWLTQDLLQAAGTGYLLIVLGALAAVLWFARGKAMKALGAAVVLGLGSILPWKSSPRVTIVVAPIELGA